MTSVTKESSPSDVMNFTDALSEFTNDKKVLRDQLVNTLLAARDTTAATLSWLFYELAYHPDAYAKLRAEVIDIIGVNGKPTYDQLKNMKYLQWCINEGDLAHSTRLIVVLRLYPIVPFNARTAQKDTTLPRGGGPNGLDVRWFPLHWLTSSRLLSRKALYATIVRSLCKEVEKSSEPRSTTSTPKGGRLGFQHHGLIFPSMEVLGFALGRILHWLKSRMRPRVCVRIFRLWKRGVGFQEDRKDTRQISSWPLWWEWELRWYRRKLRANLWIQNFTVIILHLSSMVWKHWTNRNRNHVCQRS